MVRLINDWSNSKFALNERLIITMRNAEVDSINQGIRELLKAKGLLTAYLPVKNIETIFHLKSMKIIWQEIVFCLKVQIKIYK
ncbi:hypothetical protein [Rickettsia endosymbiont of Ixodes scapularis]